MKQILIVEDEIEVVQFLKSHLESIGYKVFSIADGAQAIREVKKRKPNLILLDIMLPTVNGFDICAMLKNDASTKNIPVIMLTAKSKMSDIDEGILSGADDYIAKPYDLKELTERIKKLIDKT